METIDELLASPEFQPVVHVISLMGAFFTVACILSIIITILTIIARWKIFTKAGQGGWKSLIPIYSTYMEYKIVWAGISFWIAVVLGILSTLFTTLAYPIDMLENVETFEQLVLWFQEPTNQVFLIIGTVFGVIQIIWQIVKQYKMSRAFGHGFGYFLGLMFFPTIFILILGFGSSEYVGPND